MRRSAADGRRRTGIRRVLGGVGGRRADRAGLPDAGADYNSAHHYLIATLTHSEREEGARAQAKELYIATPDARSS